MRSRLPALVFLAILPAFGQVTPAPALNATKINGAAVPASQSCLGSNSSRQLVAGTCSGSPGGSTGDQQYNNAGAFAGSAATLDSGGDGSYLSVTTGLSNDTTGQVQIYGFNAGAQSGIKTHTTGNTAVNQTIWDPSAGTLTTDLMLATGDGWFYVDPGTGGANNYYLTVENPEYQVGAIVAMSTPNPNNGASVISLDNGVTTKPIHTVAGGALVGGEIARKPVVMMYDGVNFDILNPANTVLGPSTATVSGHCAAWNGTTGTLLSDSGIACPTGGSIIMGNCSGTITNNALVVMSPFQVGATTCTSTSAFTGPQFRAATVANLRVTTSSASNTAGGGITTIYKNGSATAVTCTLGTTTACRDLTHTFTTASNDQLTVKTQSGGGTLGGTMTYVSGDTSCTNGTQTVTFTNNTTGTNASGTITVTAGVPTGTVTITNAGSGYAAATPPTTGTVTTCTGTGTFSGGTVTVDALGSIYLTFEVI